MCIHRRQQRGISIHNLPHNGFYPSEKLRSNNAFLCFSIFQLFFVIGALCHFSCFRATNKPSTWRAPDRSPGCLLVAGSTESPVSTDADQEHSHCWQLLLLASTTHLLPKKPTTPPYPPAPQPSISLTYCRQQTQCPINCMTPLRLRTKVRQRGSMNTTVDRWNRTLGGHPLISDLNPVSVLLDLLLLFLTTPEDCSHCRCLNR